MRIRGAPAIASLAALTISLILSRRLKSPAADLIPATSASAYSLAPLSTSSRLSEWVNSVVDHLQSSRPTAVNLSEAMNRIRSTLTAYSGDSAEELAKQVIETCQAVHANDLERNKQMSKLGADWLFERRAKDGKKKLKVMTVCNTGSLATSVSTHSSVHRWEKLIFILLCRVTEQRLALSQIFSRQVDWNELTTLSLLVSSALALQDSSRDAHKESIAAFYSLSSRITIDLA
ncbi:hypothetical protein QFC22_001573 [Naganishia vaughanmartiniae]|uniref:Uncharacterized protein n=1 Tax=Naganishia vaughanmartiniae TaxID=1424756 RepID=A0ACC2XJ06_9TREE|nr:hypothetical protein QFC22_001573 [Naganishia vaughanmartiniae]